MDRAEVDRWLGAYVSAWKSYDPDEIGALFTEDVVYRYHPYDPPVEGRDAVVESWLGEGDHPGASARDEPGTYDASYRTVAVDGDLAVATGTSTYTGDRPRVFHNCMVMRFDANGRCRDYVEWYMQVP
jgi:ketosteroid isomerase-like protein